MNGVIAVDKPQEFTSFDVCAKLRGILGTRKIGHGGTLDPMATGVLPILVGNATKAAELLHEKGKSYTARFIMGVNSDTQDIWGKVRPYGTRIKPSAADIEAVLPYFRGDIKQLPPMYSAVSVGGRRLYDLARQGYVVERVPRAVTLEELTLSEFDEIRQEGVLKIRCSKGTYVRTLINDIGEATGAGAVMTALRRTSAAGFSVEDAVTLDELSRIKAAGGDFSTVLKPVDSLFSELDSLALSEPQSRMYKNGVRLSLSRLNGFTGGRMRVYSHDGEFLGVAEGSGELLIPVKNFYI